MSDQITTTGSGPNGTFNVYYSAENRQKRIEWVSGSCTVNKLYSALQNLFDELGQMDDGVPMSAQTPTEYTIGIIDAGDKDPWFIDRTTVEKLTGGALKTASWDRVTTSNVGIVKVTCNNTNIVAGDIGTDINLDGSDQGTLLDVKGTGAGSILWIRPNTFAAGDDFDSGTTLTCNTHTATFTSVTSAGESLWANIFSIGTIETNTHLYVRQGTGLLQTYKDTSPLSDWWSDGHIDILVNVKELGTESDEGVVQVFARQQSKTYDHFETDLSSGGRNPIPLSTGNDLDNQFGLRQMVLADSAGTFTVGDTITDDTASSPIKGIVTSVSGTNPTITLQYYLFSDPLVDFSAGSGTFTATSGGTATAVAPTDVNAALLTTIVITHGFATFDINENDATEKYSIKVTRSDAGTFTLNQYQQRFKYLTRWGETSTDSTDGLAGQFYIGSDFAITYSSQTANFAQGLVLTGGTSGAKGTIVADHDGGASGLLILRNSRSGATANFTAGEIITDTGGGSATISGGGVRTIAPVKASPFGIYAGGKFFGAPGVVIDPTDIAAADVSNYQLIDDDGNVVKPPTKVVITIGNTKLGDKLAAFRLTGALGDIQKDYYSATVQAIGAITVVVGEAIRVDEPGKTSEGVLRLVDNNADPTLTKEYRLRFNTWSVSTFNLFEFDANPAGAGTTTTNVNFTGVGTYAKIGDLVINHTRSEAVSYVTAIPGANDVTIFPAIALQAPTDDIELNVLPVVTATADDVYVPFIDSYETLDGSESVTITYSIDIPIRVRARRSGALSTPIIPFEQDSTVGNTGSTVNVIRTPDTIFTP